MIFDYFQAVRPLVDLPILYVFLLGLPNHFAERGLLWKYHVTKTTM